MRGILSTEAESCPHCGYPLRKGGIGGVFHAIAQIPCFIAGLILIFIALFFALILWTSITSTACYPSCSESRDTSPSSRTGRARELVPLPLSR